MSQEDKIETCNARITSAEIHRDITHTTVEIRLVYGGGATQSAGVHELDPGLVRRLMEVAEASTWSEMVGKFVRVRRTTENGVAALGQSLKGVIALGHVLEDDWHDFFKKKDDAENMPF